MDNNWIARIEECLNSIVKEDELPEGSLHIMGNQGKKSKEINSFSVCIYEPEFPEVKRNRDDLGRNLVALRIIPLEEGFELVLNKIRYEAIKKPTTAIIRHVKSDPDFTHLVFTDDIEVLLKYVRNVTQYCITHYTSKARSFGCCSRFEQCSDAKKCLHENKLYSQACYYRHHLDAGEIFYGKNKNIVAK